MITKQTLTLSPVKNKIDKMPPWIMTVARTAPLAILVGYGYNVKSPVSDKNLQRKKPSIERREGESSGNIFERRARMNFLRCTK